jgi:hemolysin D
LGTRNQKYGLLTGEVTHVSDDAIEDEKLGLVYEVFVRPEQTYLDYNGKHYDLHIGMSIQAEMKVGMRRMIEFFIYPAIRYLDEGLSVR